MSVPKTRRNESEIEFLQQARALVIYTVQKCTSFPKRYTFYISQPLANCATRVYECVKRANSIYPTNQEEVQLRRNELLLANAELYNLVGQIEIAREMFGIPGETVAHWMELVNTEILLIKGVLKKDKERYKNITGVTED